MQNSEIIRKMTEEFDEVKWTRLNLYFQKLIAIYVPKIPFTKTFLKCSLQFFQLKMYVSLRVCFCNVFLKWICGSEELTLEGRRNLNSLATVTNQCFNSLQYLFNLALPFSE